MLLTKKNFQNLLNNQELVITLIGMSNIGKTTWAKKLALEQGFKHIDFDYLLSKKLQKELQKDQYNIADLADWLGQPYEERFPSREAKLKELEKEVTEEVLETLNSSAEKTNIVLDTPGSVIYTGEETCLKIRTNSLILYIEATEHMLESMLADYFACPKPIIWNNMFQREKSEDDVNALKKCYPELLKSRHKLYKKYADLSIPYPQLDCMSKNAKDFFESISLHLPQ